MKFDRRRKMIIAMVHVGALPGTPNHRGSLKKVIDQAVAEARLFEKHGIDAILIENMHDIPYLNGSVGPEIVAAMTAVGCAIRGAVRLPLGVQILAAANHAAMGVACAIDAAFIRVENFVFAHVADEGLMSSAAAGPLLRFRRQIGAENIRIFADIKKKHAAHTLTGDISIAETAEAAEFFQADGLIVTGAATGQPTSTADLESVRHVVDLPVIVGSGTTPDLLAQQWPHADGFIVGSFIKRGGRWQSAVDQARVRMLMRVVTKLRS